MQHIVMAYLKGSPSFTHQRGNLTRENKGGGVPHLIYDVIKEENIKKIKF